MSSLTGTTKTGEIPGCRSSSIPTRISGGPFHFQLRAGTYGDVYDEIPWKVAFGIAQSRGRDPTDRSSVVRTYHPTDVLVHNWVENRRDRDVIKFRRPVNSQVDYFYKTTYQTAFNRRRCEKERLFLQKIKGFPLGIYPGHQRELDVDVLRCCAPKPEICRQQEEKEALHKNCLKQKRFDRENPPPQEQQPYEIRLS